MIQLSITSDLLNIMHANNVRLEEAFYMMCMLENKVPYISEYLRDYTKTEKELCMKPLVDKGFLRILADGTFVLAKQGVDITTQLIDSIGKSQAIAQLKKLEEQKSQMDILVTEFLELFPKGIKGNGGKTLRSNFQDTKKKMTKFIINYNYDRSTIIKATKSFIEGFRGDYRYCPVAEYFILKDGTSQLATECDRIIDNGGEEELVNPFERRM